MSGKLLFVILAAAMSAALIHHVRTPDRPIVGFSKAVPRSTPDHSGAWMWQERGPNLLDAGTYYGGYVPGKSVSLKPYSSNGGQVSAAANNMAGVIEFGPATASNPGGLTGTSSLDRPAYDPALNAR